MKMTTDLSRLTARLLVLALIVAVALPLAGCGKKKIEKPYETATLAQAVSGESENKLFKFEMTNPEILAIGTNLALLAENDRIEFLTADDLTALSTLGDSYRLAVHRAWGASPEIYLVLDYYIDGNDTTFVTSDEPPVFPSFQNFASFDASRHIDLVTELSALSDKDSRTMLKTHGKQGSKIWLEGALTRGESGGQITYYIENNLGKFQLQGINNLGETFLKAVLADTGRTTVFVTMGEVFRLSQQRVTGVTAPVTLDNFRFQNYVITNG
ncbi:MAG: hypothetical protein GY835_17255 [bacterium]|nr:hypothetical protein [bacterium]